MGALQNRFLNEMKNLTHAEKHIFYYCDSNIDKVKNMSLTTLAEENSVSTTTIIRMCNKLGVDAFSEFKFIVRSLSQEKRVKEDDFKKAIANSVNDALHNMNLKDLNKLANEIKNSKKVIVISVGLTKPLGEYFSKLLMQSGKDSIYIYESHMIKLLENRSSTEELIVFISNSGETETLIKAAERLQYSEYNTAAIINSPDSPLEKCVKRGICTNMKKASLLGYDITPRATLILMCDILFSIYRDL